MRGDILQVNQAVRGQLDANAKALAIGDRWVQKDGTIDKADMPDFLHLSAAAYDQWAQALLPEIEAALR
jgi:lysophospholipase L1-like esterase